MGFRWPEEDVTALREMWMTDEPAEVIANALGRSYNSVLSQAKKMGLPRRYGGIQREYRIHEYGVQRESDRQAAMWRKLLGQAV